MSTKPKKGRVTKNDLDCLADLGWEEIDALSRDAESYLVCQTVNNGTKTLYEKRVGLLDEILETVNSRRATNGRTAIVWCMVTFVIFLKIMADNGMGHSSQGYLNAVLFQQRRGVWGTWALDQIERLRRLVKGGAHGAGKMKERRKRGQMDEAMFESFIDFLLATTRPPTLIVAMQIAYLLSLRISEVVRLRDEDVLYHEDGSVSVELANKVYKAGNGKPPRVEKLVESGKALVLLCVAQMDKKTGDLLFPRHTWNEKMARTAVQEWATLHAFEFPNLDGVYLDGPHCLRRGGMARLKEQVVQAMHDAMLGGLAGCSTENAEAYAATNAVRGRAFTAKARPNASKRTRSRPLA